MRKKSRDILAELGNFIGILILAFAVSEASAFLNLPGWGHAALIFAGTKILADAISLVLRRQRKFLYFEDYFRETMMFMAVAAIGILGTALVERYIGGIVWVPLLAAVLVLIWR